jgi:hypothetical protein
MDHSGQHSCKAIAGTIICYSYYRSEDESNRSEDEVEKLVS